MPRRLKPAIEGDNGWTDWAYPLMRDYRISCCDCGLVHDFEFAVVEVARHIKPDRFIVGDTIVRGSKGKWRVAYRARRNERSTAQVRRHKKKPRGRAGR